MTAQHQTNEQVIHSITDTLLSLLKTQMMEEIRIVDLVRLAGVSRNSFYRNFKDKDDVLRHYISEVTDIWHDVEVGLLVLVRVICAGGEGEAGRTGMPYGRSFLLS